jgi:hypothetical protein
MSSLCLSHADNTGSNPVGDAKKFSGLSQKLKPLFLGPHLVHIPPPDTSSKWPVSCGDMGFVFDGVQDHIAISLINFQSKSHIFSF